MDNQSEKQDKGTPKPPRFNIYWVYAAMGLLLLGLYWLPLANTTKEITWDEFNQNMLQTHDVDKLVVVNEKMVEVFIKPEKLETPKYKDIAYNNLNMKNVGPHYRISVNLQIFDKDLKDAEKDFPPSEQVGYKMENRTNWGDAVGWLLPIVLFVGIFWFFTRRISSGMGGGGQIFNFGKSKATLVEKGQRVNITFNDVAGLDEAKEEVMEIVDFLKNPRKYTTLGGKIPRGALLIGPPGTGKTLIAKAMAGEAQVPFFSISGSDFVELFVGVGASRVRDLFKTAREKAPCIIFIDEIDAIGRARGRNFIQGGNDERENTLNALLVEMDGFGTDTAVILIGATNRPDVLDSALMRPGRFDRQISIDKPDMKGREQIFRVHLKPIQAVKDIDTEKLAAQTPGFAGADIANVCNEAALIAARKGKKQVEMVDFNDAIDRVIGGLEKKNKIISEEEKTIVAYHEAGHAICGWFLEHADPLLKVSIIPRGVAALGYAQYMPKEQYLYTTEQLLDSVAMTLGGRAAEDIVFGRISTGAQNDLERITKLAYAMVTIYGMNEKIGNLSFYDPQQEYGFQKPYSDETAKMIDEEVRKLIDIAYVRTKNLLTEKREQLELLAQELLKKEVLHYDALEKLIGKRPFATKVAEKKKEEEDKIPQPGIVYEIKPNDSSKPETKPGFNSPLA